MAQLPPRVYLLKTSGSSGGSGAIASAARI
jgi:hypothetical protein